MAKETLENAILFMINSYLDSELISKTDVDDILRNVRKRANEHAQ
jgi:hypothetical protein